MSGVALGAVLLSAGLHAIWNAMLKRNLDPAALAVWFVAGAASLSGALALGLGAKIPIAAWPGTIASGVVEAVYFATLTAALARLPLGTAYGLARGGGQIVTWPVSVIALGEPIGVASALGAFLVTGGLVSTASRGGSPAGLAWAAACALTIGIYPLTYKHALGAGADETALFAVSLGLALPIQIALLREGRVARLRASLVDNLATVPLGAVLCAGSFLSFLVALDLDGAGRASALRNVSVLIAAGLGAWMGEGIDSRKVAAMIAIAAGAVLVAWEG